MTPERLKEIRDSLTSYSCTSRELFDSSEMLELLDEIDRINACIEKVRELQAVVEPVPICGDRWLLREDVLAALEAPCED